jgi:beta-phosphoglucomutase family hydrolase
MKGARRVLSAERFDAVLFDLDGVLTDTAEIHARCWKTTFDDFLRKRASEAGKPFQPFDAESEYRLHVDGKPRYDGVRDFLGSRDVQLPEGAPDDPPERETVCGLGNRKDELVNQVIEAGDVEAYEGSVALVRWLRKDGIKTAVVSSSHHCAAVLASAQIADLFDARVDGETVDQLKLAGKPAPDSYLEAARRIGVKPARAVVVEDAISGVQAGKAGGFGLVVGVARMGDAAELTQNGAHLVVGDLSEMLP